MERGTGLIHFIESYRKLTRLSKPIFKSVVLKDMIEHLLVLMEYAVEHTATPKIDITANCTDIGYLEVRVTELFNTFLSNLLHKLYYFTTNLHQ